ncbi:unnamed protein product [Calicophoron daubneyi]
MLKTRTQVFGELKSRHVHPGVLRLSWAVVRSEGVFQLWQGLSAALLRHLFYTGSRVPIYETIRQEVFHLPPATAFTVQRQKSLDSLDAGSKSAKSSDTSSDASPPMEQNMGFVIRAASAGVLAGAAAQFLASPADLLKVQLQTERRWRTEAGFSPSAPNQTSVPIQRLSMVRTARRIVRNGGVLGLWRGGLPNVQRAALVNMGELTTYDTAKRWFAVHFCLEDGPLLHICASTTSGFVSAVLGTPADLIKTRIMNQRTSSSSTSPSGKILYTGVVDCFRKIVVSEGILSMYKGFFLMWARMAPWSLTFWLTYEKIRILMGVGGF